MERREAPRGCARPPQPGVRDPATRQASGTQGSGGRWGSRGARALARSPGASRRSIAARIVGGRTLRCPQASRSTTPSTEQGMAGVGRDVGAGNINFANARSINIVAAASICAQPDAFSRPHAEEPHYSRRSLRTLGCDARRLEARARPDVARPVATHPSRRRFAPPQDEMGR